MARTTKKRIPLLESAAAVATSTKRAHTARKGSKPAKKAREPTTRHPRKYATAVPESVPSPISGPPYREPKNPNATFLGLPAELRLQVYAYLCTDTLVHVHKQASTFLWTPCKAPNPRQPLLCANPKWSGLCAEEARCTHKTDAPASSVGFFGLAQTSKLVRTEAQSFFLRSTTFSVSPTLLKGWLNFLERTAPEQLQTMTKITLAGPTLFCHPWTVYRHARLEDLHARVPKLQGLGFQAHKRWHHLFQYSGTGDVHPEGLAWRDWFVIPGVRRRFGPHIAIAVELLVWRSHRSFFINGELGIGEEQQYVVRLARDAKEVGTDEEEDSGGGWTDDDVRLEIVQPGGLVEPGRTAKWRAWWRKG